MGHLRYKGTDIYGLFGKVKSVKIHEESYEFDQVGNLVAMQDEFGDRATYQYVTAASYKVEGWEDHLVSIESKDGLRTDICPDANTNAELDQIYTFDKSNRITSHKFSSHMAYITRIYTYVGDSKYPATMVQNIRRMEQPHIVILIPNSISTRTGQKGKSAALSNMTTMTKT